MFKKMPLNRFKFHYLFILATALRIAVN